MTNYRNDIPYWDYDEEAMRLGSPFLADIYHPRQIAICRQLGLDRVDAIHDYFAREPILGSYLFVTGLERVLKHIHHLSFTAEEIGRVQERMPDIATDEFLAYLEDFRFRGNLWAVPEGQLVFGQNEPILKVESNWLEGWYLETIIMSIMNGAITCSTNAAHFTDAARGIPVVDFGLRRAPGDGAKIQPVRSMLCAGVTATSNIQAAFALGQPMSGTMSHEIIQLGVLIYGSEKEAFKAYLREALKQENKLVLLVDTFDTVEGAKNAICALKEVGEELGRKLKADALRIDSGDLYELACKVRALDPEKEWFEGIFLTNNLTPEAIGVLMKKDRISRYITGLGAGTYLFNPGAIVGGVYKLSEVRDKGEWNPSLKISASADKTTLPGNKAVWRCLDEDGRFLEDVICLEREPAPSGNAFPLLEPAIVNGRIVAPERSIDEIRAFGRENLNRLPEKYRTYRSQEIFPVKLSPALLRLQQEEILRLTRPKMGDWTGWDRM